SDGVSDASGQQPDGVSGSAQAQRPGLLHTRFAGWRQDLCLGGLPGKEGQENASSSPKEVIEVCNRAGACGGHGWSGWSSGDQSRSETGPSGCRTAASKSVPPARSSTVACAGQGGAARSGQATAC